MPLIHNEGTELLEDESKEDSEMKQYLFTMFAAASCLVGCTTTIPQVEAIQLVEIEQAVAGCTYLTNVRGDGVTLQGATYNDTISQMKMRTAQAGGNRLLIVHASSGMGGAVAIGDAYKC